MKKNDALVLKMILQLRASQRFFRSDVAQDVIKTKDFKIV